MWEVDSEAGRELQPSCILERPTDTTRLTDGAPLRRRERSDKGRLQFTPRDLTTLTWIAEQYAIHVKHLRVLLARRPGKPTQVPGVLGPTTTANLIARWKYAGLIEVQRVLAAEAPWIWLTRTGLVQLELAYAPYQPSAAALPHLAAINAVRMLLEARRGHALHWESERMLRQERGRLAKGRSWQHLPDAVVALDPMGDAVRIAIEVELTPKAPERLAAILGHLVDDYTAVWYFVGPEARLAVVRAISSLDTHQRQRIRVYTLNGEELALSSNTLRSTR